MTTDRPPLFCDVAREYLPAPKANFVRVVVNGESWGLYVNTEQFNKDFIKEWYGTTKGARWKVPGSPGGEFAKTAGTRRRCLRGGGDEAEATRRCRARQRRRSGELRPAGPHPTAPAPMQ